MLQKLIDLICRLFSFLMVVCLALMVVMVFGNVVLRYGFNSGITVSEELSRWLFVWMTFLGALVALRHHGHLGTDSLVSRLPVAGRKICLGLSHLLMLYMCWLMASGAWQQTLINRGTTSAVMEASMAWLYASGLVFAVLAVIVLMHEFWRLISGQIADDDLIAIIESEEDVAHPNPASAVATANANAGVTR
ncbi:TRAP transporter small permease [Caenimonas sp. SL110]|uniref:TRAP transporter small permease n=1 Tax=Caenimonas sp. SL110 TaxID=1450524 RepID=UPI000653F957|nr:TRAP transporter small permease [Caenimonas sp. SL110]